jgi:hypothetical protein
MAGFFDFLFGRGDQLKQVPTMNPQQQQTLSGLLSQVQSMQGPNSPYGSAQSYLQNILGGGEGAFNAFEAPALRQFRQQVTPGIAEQFGAMGTGAGSTLGSGFQNALANASTDLSERLAAMRANLQGGAAQTAIGNYQNLLGQGLGAQPFGYYTQAGNPGFLAQSLAPALGTYLGGSLPGFGNLFSSLFSRGAAAPQASTPGF